MASMFDGKSILITGATGSFGSHFVRRVLRDHKPHKVTVFSRDELKQSEMAAKISDPRVRYLLGDIRDVGRLQRAFHGVNIVVHAAALKQVPTLEYNPFEAVQTNIIGGENIINAAIDQGVERVVALSTDKAVNPVNLYGATKLCMEKLFVAGNAYAGGTKTRFSVVRYGNVLGSRGSVLHVFNAKKGGGRIPITDERMTRFWITLDQGVDTVYFALENMHGGEIFIPKIPSMRVTDLARVVAPDCRIDVVGVRPGEKLHETLITEEESSRSVDARSYYVICPLYTWWDSKNWKAGEPVPEGFRYASDSNDKWMDAAKMKELVEAMA